MATPRRPPAEKTAETAEPAPLDMDAVLNAKRRRTKPVPIRLDDGDTARVFVMASIGREGWEQLIDDHQPTDEQQDEHRQEQLDRNVPPLMITGLRWNTETFAPALIAAACIDPPVTVEQATRLWTDPAWSARECRELFDAALEVNDPMREAWSASLGKDWPGIPSSGPSVKPPITT